MDGDLPSKALAAVEKCVRMVIREQGCCPDAGLYKWTRNYGAYGPVDLVAPPGDPTQWARSATRVERAFEETYLVVVDMWTKLEGRSDLSLEIVLTQHDGQWHAQAEALHVL